MVAGDFPREAHGRYLYRGAPSSYNIMTTLPRPHAASRYRVKLFLLGVCLCSCFTFFAAEVRKNDDRTFYAIAIEEGTDKATWHNYYLAYDKYLNPKKDVQVKFLEIGLGCDMKYGPGKSAAVWRRLFTHPRSELWEAEADGSCLERWKDKLGGNTLVGDQSDFNVLRNWTQITGGEFDVIIDDGGHSYAQQMNSFRFLFVNALKPGGMYFMEDLVSNAWSHMADGPERPVTKILEWQETLMLEELALTKREDYDVDGLQSIECFKGICVFFKCPTHVPRCP